MKASEPLIVRERVPGDNDALRRIIELSFDSGIYRFFAIRSLDSAERIIVIDLGGRVAGFVEPRQVRIGREKVGNILWLATHPDFRRIGVASRLIDECLKYLEEQSMRRIYISVESDNKPSLALFEKKGFKRIRFRELVKEYGLRVLTFYSRMLIAPDEIVLVKMTEGVREPSST